MTGNFLTDDTKAIILLCGVLGKESAFKPLTQGEYTSLVQSLIDFQMRPKDLLQKMKIKEVAEASNIDKDRLEKLIGRGVELGFAVEEWQRNGIWIISRSDPEYPSMLKKNLKEKAPPLLYGAGDKSLLRGGGLAIVGSRNIDQAGEDFTRYVAKLCAKNSVKVVSGGARGVDQIAMMSAISSGGVSIGIVSDSLLSKSLEKDFRNAIAHSNLLLISPFNPKAGFFAGNAMARNKLIYALADYSLVVSSDYNKGGTWSGAVERLNQNNGINLFVRTGNDVPKGNQKLLEKGAIPWPEIIDDYLLREQLNDAICRKNDLDRQNNLSIEDFLSNDDETTVPTMVTNTDKLSLPSQTIYDAVLPTILKQLKEPKSVDELASKLDIYKSQLGVWLKKAVEEGKINKLNNPVRYQANKEK